MNKYCNIIDSVKIYTEGVFRSPKHFSVFDPALNPSAPAAIFTSKKCIESHIYSSLNTQSQKTANEVFFKIVELTKQLPYKTKE